MDSGTEPNREGIEERTTNNYRCLLDDIAYEGRKYDRPIGLTFLIEIKTSDCQVLHVDAFIARQKREKHDNYLSVIFQEKKPDDNNKPKFDAC
jgi:hypothetical protein